VEGTVTKFHNCCHTGSDELEFSDESSSIPAAFKLSLSVERSS